MGVARAGNLAVQHCQLVAQDSDLDVLVVGPGTQVDQPEDASYEEEHEGRGHAGHPASCTSWLLRAAVLCLHPSRRSCACTLQVCPHSSDLPVASKYSSGQQRVASTGRELLGVLGFTDVGAWAMHAEPKSLNGRGMISGNKCPRIQKEGIASTWIPKGRARHWLA